MTFLNPAILWGTLGLLVPIIIHFWHKKQGKELLWAATQWLDEKTLQKAKSVRLENLLLLLLRILLVLLVTFILSEPVLHFLEGKKTTIHWIQPSKEVVENFKFEIHQAKERGEACFWFGGESVESLDKLPVGSDLQVGLNAKTLSPADHIEFYISNQDDFSNFPKIVSPASYHLNIAKKSNIKTDYIPLQRTWQTLIETREPSVIAALKAISELYDIQFLVDEKRIATKKYDLSFTETPDPTSKVNVVSNSAKLPLDQMVFSKNIHYINTNLNPQASEMVFNGKLPEVILQAIGKKSSNTLSTKQLNERFSQQKAGSSQRNPNFGQSLFLLLLVLVGVERYFAIKKNV